MANKETKKEKKSPQRLESYTQRFKKVTTKFSVPVEIKRLHLVIALLVVVLLGVFGIIYSHIDRQNYKATQVLYMVQNHAGWPHGGSWSTKYVGQGTWVVSQTSTSGREYVWFFKEQTGEVMTAKEAEREYGLKYSPPHKKAKKVEAQNAEVALDGSQLIIKNNNSYDWTGMKLILNNDYKYGGVPKMGPGGTYHVPLDYFTTKTGEKFNPSQQKVETLILMAITQYGVPYEERMNYQVTVKDCVQVFKFIE